MSIYTNDPLALVTKGSLGCIRPSQAEWFGPSAAETLEVFTSIKGESKSIIRRVTKFVSKGILVPIAGIGCWAPLVGEIVGFLADGDLTYTTEFDLVRIVGKGALALIPFVGPLVAEAFGALTTFVESMLVKVHCKRGIANSLNGKQDAAIANWRQALRLNPNYATAYNNIAYAKIHQCRYKSAIANCKKAIHLNPKFATAYNNKGYAEIGLCRYKSAIANCKKAIHLNPKFATAYANRGIASLYMGRIKDAKSDFREAKAFASHSGNKDLLAKINRKIKQANMR